MARKQYVVRREAGYYYQRRVPEDLVAILGKKHIRHTLKTRDPDVAAERARDKAAADDRLFREL